MLTGRTTGGTTATFDWGTSGGLPLLLSDGANDYLYGPDGTPIEQEGISSGSTQYYVSDDQGSTRALLSSAGSVDATYIYDAYGNLTSSSGTASTPLLYDGQYQDPVSGLYYLRARWYDPATAELLSVDPDLAETNEAYEYAGDNPVNDGDPSGLDCLSTSQVVSSSSAGGKMSAQWTVPNADWHQPPQIAWFASGPSYSFDADALLFDPLPGAIGTPSVLYFFISDLDGAGGTGDDFTLTDESTGYEFRWDEGQSSFDITLWNGEDGPDELDGAATFYLVGSSHSYASPIGFMKRKSPHQIGYRIHVHEDLTGDDYVPGFAIVYNWLKSDA